MNSFLKRKRNQFEDHTCFETLAKLDLCKTHFPLPGLDETQLSFFIGALVQEDNANTIANQLLDEVKELHKSNTDYRFDLRVCNVYHDVFARSDRPVTVEQFIDVAQQYLERVVQLCNGELANVAKEFDGLGEVDEAFDHLYTLYELAEQNVIKWMSCVWVRCGKNVYERRYDSNNKRFTSISFSVRTHLDVRPSKVHTLRNIEQWRAATFHDALVQINGRQKKNLQVTMETRPLSELWHQAGTAVKTPALEPSVCKPVPSTVFNLWQQFDYRRESVADAVDFHNEWFVRMLLHIRYTWCDNSKQFAYVLGWMAFLIQRPDVRSHVILGVLGEQGTGKSAVFALLRKIIGKAHSLETNKRITFTGRFTSETDEKIYTHVDDAMCEEGDSEHLKGLATSEEARRERKGQNAVTTANQNSFSFANNKTLPLSSDARDRRLHCVQSRPNAWVTVCGTEGATMVERINTYTHDLFDHFEHSEAFRVFANFLYNVDLSVLMDGKPFDYMCAPESVCADLIRYERARKLSLVNWWAEMLRTGEYCIFNNDNLSLSDMRELFHRWGGKKAHLTKASFETHCMTLQQSETQANMHIPSVEQCRAQFQQRYPGYVYASSVENQDTLKLRHILGSQSTVHFKDYVGPDHDVVQQRMKEFLPAYIKYRNVQTGKTTTLMQAINDNEFRVLNEWEFCAKIKYEQFLSSKERR